MVRLAAKTDDEIVKSIVKEVRDASKKALTLEDYAEIGWVHFDKERSEARINESIDDRGFRGHRKTT